MPPALSTLYPGLLVVRMLLHFAAMRLDFMVLI